VWKWPVVKYKHIKIKPRICMLFILCLTVNAAQWRSKQDLWPLGAVVKFAALSSWVLETGEPV